MLARFSFVSAKDAEEVYKKVFLEVGYAGGTSRYEKVIVIYESCMDPCKVREICLTKGGKEGLQIIGNFD